MGGRATIPQPANMGSSCCAGPRQSARGRGANEAEERSLLVHRSLEVDFGRRWAGCFWSVAIERSVVQQEESFLLVVLRQGAGDLIYGKWPSTSPASDQVRPSLPPFHSHCSYSKPRRD
jgi:hypothetical protein